MKNIRSRLGFFAVAALPVLAQAHPGHDAGISYASGALHPLGGFDHLLALLAVGLLAARMGGRALLAIPAAFLALLAVGIALGFEGVQLDFVEPAIMASILVCGGLAVLPPRHLPVATAALAALFAIFHGNAHGTEVVAGVGRVPYAAGLMTSSALVIGITAFVARSATWTVSARRH
ncbi:MAG: HupE/UreJ family protein [Pseudomonadota bacterium]